MPPPKPLLSSAPSLEALERVLAVAADGCEAEEPWVARTRGGLERVLDLLAAEPALARAAAVEAAAAGPEARRTQWETIERLAGCLDPEPWELEGREEMPDNVALMAVGGVAGLIGDVVRAGQTASLPALLPDLLFVLLLPYLGPQEAAVEMHRVAQRGT